MAAKRHVVRRRMLLKFGSALVAAAAGSVVSRHGAGAESLDLLEEQDEQALELGYRSDATTVDPDAYPKYRPGQVCAGCAVFQGRSGELAGPCLAFPGKAVSARGWCTAWTRRA
ncbi:MAG: high-potential iron-sulfur protein [Betaproteobacteria bacterium]